MFCKKLFRFLVSINPCPNDHSIVFVHKTARLSCRGWCASESSAVTAQDADQMNSMKLHSTFITVASESFAYRRLPLSVVSLARERRVRNESTYLRPGLRRLACCSSLMLIRMNDIGSVGGEMRGRRSAASEQMHSTALRPLPRPFSY